MTIHFLISKLQMKESNYTSFFFSSVQQPVGAELVESRSMPTSALLAAFGPETRADVGIRPYGSEK
jgi:hypothetical protein